MPLRPSAPSCARKCRWAGRPSADCGVADGDVGTGAVATIAPPFGDLRRGNAPGTTTVDAAVLGCNGVVAPPCAHACTPPRGANCGSCASTLKHYTAVHPHSQYKRQTRSSGTHRSVWRDHRRRLHRHVGFHSRQPSNSADSTPVRIIRGRNHTDWHRDAHSRANWATRHRCYRRER